MAKHQKITFGKFKRRLKGKRTEVPPAVKDRILASVLKGESHWSLDPDDLALPMPDQGSRRIVFESVFGPVSATSEVYPNCHDPQCVNPYHCVVENVKTHLMKLQGKLPRLVFSGPRQTMEKGEFERSLVMAPSRMKLGSASRRQVAKETEAMRKKSGDFNLAGCGAEDPLGSPESDPASVTRQGSVARL